MTNRRLFLLVRAAIVWASTTERKMLMTTLLHIDSSARPGRSGLDARGSHTRRLTDRFVQRWLQIEPTVNVIYRDVGANPPPPVSGDWIRAAFTPESARDASMRATLSTSDELVAELLSADVIVVGVPMYNFGPPAQFKAYIDNIVRVGKTFGFDRRRVGDPYWPLLAEHGKRLVILSSRGDYGYEAGERIADRNHVEASVRTAFAYIGITQSWNVAVEYDEFGDGRVWASIAKAEQEVDRRVLEFTRSSPCRRASDPAAA
jgi:FMN-dependent NADH-azoreductase